ncbi:MAG: transglycosylase SLT domain-containing protein [Aquabacterium sp.]
MFDKYALHCLRALAGVSLALGLSGATPWCLADDDGTVQEAREALRVRDETRLLAARDALLMARHPLAPWADYWYFQARLIKASPSEVDAFLQRWPDAYVADRARNDWLLELGRRQDWRTFLRIQPTFRMNDDREVTCLGLLARHQTSMPVEGPGDLREQARQAWWAQRDADWGCDTMAQTLLANGVLTQSDVWRKLRLSIEGDKPKAITQTSRLLGDALSRAVSRALADPRAFLMPTARAGSLAAHGENGRARSPGASIGPRATGKAAKSARRKGAPRPTLAPLPLEIPVEAEGPLNLLAFIRWASMDHVAAAAAIDEAATRARWRWNAEESAWAWSQLGRWAAWRLSPEAPAYFERGLVDRALASGTGALLDNASAANRVAANWSSETLAWMARAGLRAGVAGDRERWKLVEQAIDAMPEDARQDAAWQYWKAKAIQARAQSLPLAGAEVLRHQARELLQRVASPVSFYGQLAAEDLTGAPVKPPPPPAPLTEAELAQARSIAGIDRALRMLQLGWRSEALREWNFTLGYGRPGGLTERELLAVAEEACRREIWDRCINTSDRTRREIHLEQRYPTPYRADVLAAAGEVGLDPAYMYGLIRQESRFQLAVRSHVGASGLMQVMPATAAWTARKLRISYEPALITERTTNLRIGAGYLKLVLDDFQGTQALAAAAYNAGPARSRRWREGPRLDAAAWVENIPFSETRDYVKKVLSNATVYGHLLHGRPLSIKTRLGSTIGPRAESAPPPEEDLP